MLVHRSPPQSSVGMLHGSSAYPSDDCWKTLHVNTRPSGF
jgi:hypothetical protein